jgi:hypothetical protein
VGVFFEQLKGRFLNFQIIHCHQGRSTMPKKIDEDFDEDEDLDEDADEEIEDEEDEAN